MGCWANTETPTPLVIIPDDDGGGGGGDDDGDDAMAGKLTMNFQ